MFSCKVCGNTKFHLIEYVNVGPEGLLPLTSDFELRCVGCHEVYLYTEVMNGFNADTSPNGRKEEKA